MTPAAVPPLRPRPTAKVVKQWGEFYASEGRRGVRLPPSRSTVDPARVIAACALPRFGLVLSCSLDAPASPVTRLRFGPDDLAEPLVGRAVLLDVARGRRRPWLEDGAAILPEELDQCAERQGLAFEPGDVLLVRTGKLARARADGRFDTYVAAPAPGLSVHCARWLFEREIAAVATDTWAVEVVPSEVPELEAPLRDVALGQSGLGFGENFDLEALAAACARDGNYAFLLVALQAGTSASEAGRGPARVVAIK